MDFILDGKKEVRGSSPEPVAPSLAPAAAAVAEIFGAQDAPGRRLARVRMLTVLGSWPKSK